MIQEILLGTYTRRESEGIYSLKLDTDKETIKNLKLVAEEQSPTYLSKSKRGEVYSVTSVNEKGGAAAYNEKFKIINTVTKEGAPLCYIAVDESRQLVYGSNYHEGEVTVYKILDNGGLEQTDLIIHDEPTGSHENQNNPHVHYSDLTPDGRLAVCDLGTDRVYTYDISSNGHLHEVSVYKAEDSTGPRHLTFHPNSNYAYLLGELDSSITVLNYNQSSGQFSKIKKYKTIPEDFHDFNAGAAIRISNDGQFVYMSNRGHDTISVFAIIEDGADVEFVEYVSTEGNTPRDFNIDPTGNFLVAANLDSDNLTLFKRDNQNGKLTLISKDIYAPEVVCVLFTD